MAKATGSHLAVVQPGASREVWSVAATADGGDHDFGRRKPKCHACDLFAEGEERG